jgi:hypothetical protein
MPASRHGKVKKRPGEDNKFHEWSGRRDKRLINGIKNGEKEKHVERENLYQ